MKNPCAVTISGRIVDLVNPDPETICIYDIAHHLSLINRFTGATPWPYSVAAHSVWVSHDVPPEYALYGLLHDSSEAYTNDISTPVKSMLPDFRSIEDVLLEVILRKFGLTFPVPKSVKESDDRAISREAHELMPKVGCFADSYPVGRPLETIVWWKARAAFERRFKELYVP